jgi:patatin-like phospholipase/acyl hydrolase
VLLTRAEGRDIGNRYYPLGNLVRASTAAPFYFEPEWLEIISGERPGLFVDGGATPHNNPSVMLFLVSILDAYHLGWKATPDDLTIVSVGAGSSYAKRGSLMQRTMGK